MERIRKSFLFGLIEIFIITHLCKAEVETGSFISLDCGMPSNESSYTEKSTGLTLSSDADFIHSGKSGMIRNEEEYLTPYKHLRYFPEGTRNCYSFSVMQGTVYLIRAVFVYENYDGLKKSPKFDLSLGHNFWTTIDLEVIFFLSNGLRSNILNGITEESIHMPKSNSLDICVINTGAGIPFISTLELRPLRDDTYITETVSLKLLSRRYLSDTESIIRYPDDVHDREWIPDIWNDMMYINTTAPVDATSAFKIPQPVISNAGIADNIGKPLSTLCLLRNPDEHIHLYLHFADIQALKPKDSRMFDILWNDDKILTDYSPYEFMVDTVALTTLSKCDSNICELKLVKAKKSTLPPLLNAVEAFEVIPLQPGTDENDLSAIKSIQATYKLHRISWQGDPCVPEQFLWDGLKCSSNTKLSTPPRIISLDLSSSGLSGTIPREIENLSQLQKLDLSNNNFSRGVPEFLADMKSLTVINLSWNNLNGSIPSSLREREKKGLKIIVQGNPNLCLSPSCELSGADDGNNLKKFKVPILASVVSIAFITVVLLMIIFVYRRKRQSKALNPSIVASKRSFTYEEVTVMTKNFEIVLGEGGFGMVYHGYLNGNEPVAVKLLSQSSAQGYKQFKAEVELLLRVHHINLVSLVGYCDEGNSLVLIYDYMPNGDLKQHLSGECAKTSLSWEIRLRIAAETAQGLEYLHTGCQPPMIHRDVKTTNILLDEHFEAKIGDFGLSRSFPMGSETHVSTNVAGSPGYLDPEYYRTNRLTEKSDVYSFGIVLLEIITRRSVIDQTREKPHIAEWVGFRLTNGDIENIVDPSLAGNYDSNSLWKVLELAMSCVSPSSSGRPNMSHVSNELKMCLSSENSRKRGRPDMDSESSLERNTSFGPEHNPDAR